MNLQLIYHFNASQSENGDFIPPSYGVVYFFSDQGFLELAFLQEMAKVVPDADHHRLTFVNLDDLKAFALRVCEELDAKQVRLISVQDFNIGVDGAKDKTSFRSIFSRYGEGAVPEGAIKRKGLLGKFFG